MLGLGLVELLVILSTLVFTGLVPWFLNPEVPKMD